MKFSTRHFLLILVGILVVLLSIYVISLNSRPSVEDTVRFLGEFSLAEQLEIKKDLGAAFAKVFADGVKMRVKKVTLPNCDPLQRECTQYLVEYVYNEHGDWVPGYLYKEGGVFKYKPSI